MAKRAKRVSSPPSASSDPPPAAAPSPTSLAALAALGMATSLWALFLWGELVLSRRAGTPFCALGAGTECTALWDSAFASAVHRLTGLPVAGWGLVWGLAAFVLPLVALVHTARRAAAPGFVSAIRLLAASGVVTVFMLLGVAAVERALCLGCLVSYFLVGSYAGIALGAWSRAGFPEPRRGAVLALAAAAGAFVLLLYPGLHTPRRSSEAGREAVASLARDAAPSAVPSASTAGGAGGSARDQKLRELVGSMRPDLRQTLSDSLQVYRSSPPLVLPPARSLVGSPRAPVRITEFTDVLCDHCADLHETLEALRRSLPMGSFSVEPRQFPLDAECNPLIRSRSDPVRCLAAKAKICLEDKKDAGAFTAALFQNQKGLKPDQVFSLAAPFLPRAALEACVASPATQGRLAEDIDLASRTDPDGTPIVLVNGRRGTSFGPFLYAMVLTGGEAEHPAFAGLPPANPAAHLH
jgi:serine/threonine-protein kinase